MKKALLALALALVSGEVFAQALPRLAEWESNMTTAGAARCAELGQDLLDVYYDGPRVYRQIKDYTGNAAWDTCSETAEVEFIDEYVLGPARVAGNWNFTRGARMDWERNADADSRTAILKMTGKFGEGTDYCRDVDYTSASTSYTGRDSSNCLVALLDAEAIGEAQQVPKRDAVLAIVKDYIDQRFITKDLRVPDNSETQEYIPYAVNKYYYQPFMVGGFIVRALIQAYEQTSDATIPPLVQTGLDVLWTDAWVAADESMWYENYKDDPEDAWPVRAGARDLNLLIAPGYAWLYSLGYGTSYRDKFDALFEGGVQGAYLGDGKQFNQNYMWSIQGVAWRNTVLAPVITTAALPDAQVGQAYSQLVTVVGGTTPYTQCNETVGSLPAGSPAFASTPEASGCRITGTPTGTGTSNFTEQVIDNNSQNDTQALSITAIAATPLITTTGAHNGAVDLPYSLQVVCTGGTAPLTFTVQSGALCQGTSLVAGTGVISGTPTTVETCSYTIRCTDNAALFDDQAFSNSILAAGTTIVSNINHASTSVVLQAGYPTLDRDADCQVQVFQALDLVGTSVTPYGLASRWFAISGLTANTYYTAQFDCESPETTGLTSFTTRAASTGAQAVKFKFGAPLSILTGAARVTVYCDDDPGLGSPTSVQNVTCGAGCEVEHSLTAGVYYCYWQWQNAGDTVLAQGRLLALPVP